MFAISPSRLIIFGGITGTRLSQEILIHDDSNTEVEQTRRYLAVPDRFYFGQTIYDKAENSIFAFGRMGIHKIHLSDLKA